MNSFPLLSRSCLQRSARFGARSSKCSAIQSRSSISQSRNLSTTHTEAQEKTIDISTTLTPSNQPATKAAAAKLATNSSAIKPKLDPRTKKQSTRTPTKSQSNASSSSTTTPSVELPPLEIPAMAKLQPPRNQTRNSSNTSTNTETETLRIATVTRTNTMQNCVRVTLNKQIYAPYLRKYYTRPQSLLIHDPNPKGYINEGDVIQFGRFSEEEISQKIANQEKYELENLEKFGKVKRNGKEVMRVLGGLQGVNRRVKMTGEDRRGKHGGTKDVKRWDGPRWIVRGVVTPFGTNVEDRVQVQV